MPSSTMEVLTIGHSSHSLEHFLALLRLASVTAVADVRSSPYSKHAPQFSRSELCAALRVNGLSYVFLGKELGGRPNEQLLYRAGVADYETMAARKEFDEGLNRIIEGATTHRIALMCSERDPLDCHRCLLVGRALAERGVRVSHVLGDGGIMSHEQIEDRLLELSGRHSGDLFASRSELLAAAYRERARKVAFVESQPSSHAPVAAG